MYVYRGLGVRDREGREYRCMGDRLIDRVRVYRYVCTPMKRLSHAEREREEADQPG
jgi:hypothetical protein